MNNSLMTEAKIERDFKGHIKFNLENKQEKTMQTDAKLLFENIFYVNLATYFSLGGVRWSGKITENRTHWRLGQYINSHVVSHRLGHCSVHTNTG